LRCEEDVVVLAHTHTWKENEIQSSKKGNVFYLNTGTWVDFHDVSTAEPLFFFQFYFYWTIHLGRKRARKVKKEKETVEPSVK